MTRIRTIAVGFDQSEDSIRAARWAAALAAPLGWRVVLVHARGLLERYEHASLAASLNDLAEALTKEFDLAPDQVRGKILEGDALSVLLSSAEEPLAADLVVVGTRGAGAHSGLLLGSTSLQLAERVTIPLVVVPTGMN
jgi:nucleotide-binding universal stress UspA family protein